MKHLLSLAEITASDHEVVGGKALALASIHGRLLYGIFCRMP